MIVWDEPKRLSNIEKHQGLDFAAIDAAFWSSAMLVEAKPGSDGRPRWKAIGLLGDIPVVVLIYSPLGSEAISAISLRPASRKERKVYDERTA
ncbi:BrnT family toxin [Aureimonas sp. Leaf324]|uniref:BrnT family toxin n=1 Tax=Aureimonas sp. Leaf324 TaxID=1736336 RepID=UPI0006F4F757|nr:BrnT family toxin [Aureimonas sp. Leaf324]KQQ83636.1 hypothetical protein ASF65_20440 [Aureimonas sp. Leaf324]